MIKHLLLLCVFIGFFSCKDDKKTEVPVVNQTKAEASNADIVRMPVSAKEPLDTVNIAKFEFEETVYNFRKANEGEFVEHAYKFKNVGTIPLIIKDAKTTCGCTVPKWPKDPIPPGGSGVINVKFNTAGKTENQSKPITLIANTYPSKTILKIEGYVIKGFNKK